MNKHTVCFEADNNTLSVIIAPGFQIEKNKALSFSLIIKHLLQHFLLIVLCEASNTKTSAVKSLETGCFGCTAYQMCVQYCNVFYDNAT